MRTVFGGLGIPLKIGYKGEAQKASPFTLWYHRRFPESGRSAHCMIKRLKKLFSRQTTPDAPLSSDPQIVAAGSHAISARQISSGCRKVVEQLDSAGYSAYVVGGCVRDLLLDLHPKDFDVATNATPEEICALFRRSRIVGRRFQIVHVRMGREVIEVTTFRGPHNGDDGDDSRQSEAGMLLRDNRFGTITEDAHRRDFTVNALYYHPQDETVFDFSTGLADVERRQLRIIGHPETRYREDPVRMLRAARLAAKLDFTIEPHTEAPIRKLAGLLGDIPQGRLFDESLKLFLGGYAAATYRELRRLGLFKTLFAETDRLLDAGSEDDFNHRFVEQALHNTDQRLRNNQRVTPAFLLAALLWPVLVKHLEQLKAHQERNNALVRQRAANEVIDRALQQIAIPRRFSTPMREIWDMQERLPRRQGSRADRLMEHPRFRAAYDFLLLRESAGEDLGGLGQWWTRYQAADESQRRDLVAKLDDAGDTQRRKRRPRRRKPPQQA